MNLGTSRYKRLENALNQVECGCTYCRECFGKGFVAETEEQCEACSGYGVVKYCKEHV